MADSRFNAKPRELTPADRDIVSKTQAAFAAVEGLLGQLHSGKGTSISAAMHHLEAAYMWAMRDFAGLNAELPKAPPPQPVSQAGMAPSIPLQQVPSKK